LSKFGWADGFWSINSEIKNYGNCKTLEEVEEMSKKNEDTKNTMKQRSY
jgi:ribosome biogenesis protein Tsr3